MVINMLSPCDDNCANRQESLDPYGCFHEHGSTGIVGRFMTSIFGCKYYRRLDNDNRDE